MGRRPAAEGQAHRSGAWCRRPATAARCSSAATPTSPTTCRTRISSSSRATGKLNIVSTPYSNGIQYIGMNVTKPPFDNLKVRQAVAYAIPYQKIMDAVLFGLAKPMFGAPADTPTEVAWPQPHKFNTDIAKAKQLHGRGRLSQRLRDHAVVRSRLRRRQRAALRADAGEPRADRHQDARSTRSRAPTGAPS